MVAAVLEGRGEDDVLARAEACAEGIRDFEAELLRLACEWAVLNDPDRLDPVVSALPGREKAKRYGGAGTPHVTEFAAATLGVRIGRSPYAARELMADALDLCYRLPELWARVEDGDVRVSYARFVCRKTRDLETEEAAYVDAAVAESADGRISWSRFEVLVEAKVAAAAPALAREKEERASKARFAKKLRGEANGMATFMVRADIATINAIDAAVTQVAASLVEAMPDCDDDARRVHAVLLLTHPGATPETPLPDLLPTVQLFLHSYLGADGDPIARLEGHGPVTLAWVTRVLGPTCRFKIQQVMDIEGQAPVDAYEVPDRHRQAVALMTPADVFPFATCLSRDLQIDHTVPFGQGGESGVGNYGPMTVPHHRIKTHGGFEVAQPFPGIYVWKDPHGGFCLVDHTGTRRLPRTGTGIRRSSVKPLVRDIQFRGPRIDLDPDFTTDVDAA